jgi:hypothetical protein
MADLSYHTSAMPADLTIDQHGNNVQENAPIRVLR